MLLTFECSKQGKAGILKVSGRLDGVNAPDFEDACKNCVSGESTHLLVDMSGLSYISSSGLRSFLNLAKMMQAGGGVMMLCGMRGLVKEVFDMTRLTPLFTVFPDTASALATL